jgi:UDP-MurNAc hydroxylase
MDITYLGHAAFLVETDQAILVTDPWLSPEGAFDSAWFQFPCNHHLGDFLREKLRDTPKQAFLYVSHEHRDHFDPEFIKTLPTSKMTFLLPRFERAALRTELATMNPAALIPCEHGQSVPIPGGTVKLYLDDSGISRDSAILIKAADQSFLDMNDCKLYDEVAAIRKQEGPITVLSCQFSGATWHPTCYEYDAPEYERISRQKLLSKFEMVARAIDAVSPDIYLPSAGPACFLDPDLLHLNFEPVNIFPRSAQFLEFLQNRLQSSATRLFDVMPGDVVNSERAEFQPVGEERVTEENFAPYIRDYAARYADYFADKQPLLLPEQFEELLTKLATAIQEKLSVFTLRERIQVPLYVGFRDFSDALLRVDFPANRIERVNSMPESNYYSLKAPSWQLARILDHSITWEEFALTFRMRLNRKPDVYQTLIQGFLLMEPEDMNWFCGKILEIEQRKNRIIVEAGGTRYSIDRFCPHQGADLSQGWLAEGRLWTCPRHRWQFALDKEGRCLTSNGTINAVCLEND